MDCPYKVNIIENDMAVNIATLKNINTPEYDYAKAPYFIENTITNVTPEYLERISSKKTAPRKIKIDIFQSCYSHILKNGEITRGEINHLYPKRISSIIFAVLAEIPFFDIISTPKAKKTLVLDKKEAGK